MLRQQLRPIVWLAALALCALASAGAQTTCPAAQDAAATTSALSLESGAGALSDALSSAADPQSICEALRRSLSLEAPAADGGVSPEKVLAIALDRNPNWGTFAANHAAARAELLKACAYPNPEFEVELGRARAREREEGSRPSRSIYGLAFSQPIELPGKRLARRVEAEAGFAVVDAEGFEYSASLRADVLEAYYTVQFYGAQERLWQVLLNLSEELQRIAARRVELEEGGMIETVNTRIQVLKAAREREAAKRKRLGARAALNALAGGSLPAQFRLSQALPEALAERSEKKAVESALACHPRLRRLAAELEQRYASLDRERTEWWPDVSVGVRQGKEFDAEAAAVTAGIEIPLWNRNQGAIAAAKAAAQKTYNDIHIAFTELRRDVEVAYQEYEMTRVQLQAYEGELKSASEQAVAIACFQYREGVAGYLDVVSALELLQEYEQEYLQARYDAALARVRLERAMGVVIRCPERKNSQTPRGRR